VTLQTSPERSFVEQRLLSATAESESAGRRAERLSWARLIVFVIAVILFAAGRPWSTGAAIGAAGLFVLLATMHRRVAARTQRAREMAAAAGASLARMDRRWDDMPPARTVELRDESLNFAAARDLDITGRVSLFRLLDMGLPDVGGRCTLGWLLSDPPPLEVLRARQASVAALRQRPELLLESARSARFSAAARLRPPPEYLEGFRRWCAARDEPLARWLVLSTRILTTVLLAAIVVATVLPAARGAAAAVATVMIPLQLVAAAIARRHLRRHLGVAADLLPAAGGVADAIQLITSEREVEGRYGEVQRVLTTEHAGPAIARLSRLFEWDAVRHSPMLHAVANALVALDVHVAAGLDAWRAASGSLLSRWIDLVGEAQALTALGTLAYENPGWMMPDIHEAAEPALDAGECGHPLLPREVAVTNPVSLAMPGDVLVLTGSNMSGKTTYLRSVGLNALLAMAGGAVCAHMRIRRCRVRTSVRVEDDLSRGASLFFAEVSRLRDIVADAEHAVAPPVLFLLDEVLHGTNAPDRRRATQLVLERLAASGSAGVVTTHDPEIAGVEGTLADRAHHAHFSDSVEAAGDRVGMVFDYRLRDGPATTTNALRILQLLGLSGAGRT
jgi:ABC-type transport system involved in cytochrome c biogenesis ATPase subunit